MYVYRLCNHDFKILDGEGARLYGGRWNSVGLSVVYTSEHLSLCVLEQLVHLSLTTIPVNWISLKIEIPNKIKGDEITSLPKTDHEAKRIGDKWIQTKKSLYLKVPSSIIQTEYNFLINPAHRDMKEIKIVDASPFKLDSRLLN